MGEVLSVLPCVCAGIKLTVDELVDLRVKMRDNDPDIMKTLLELTENLHKYKKKDRKKILELISTFLKNNISLQSSAQVSGAESAADLEKGNN
jgi:hypothetical protein